MNLKGLTAHCVTYLLYWKNIGKCQPNPNLTGAPGLPWLEKAKKLKAKELRRFPL